MVSTTKIKSSDKVRNDEAIKHYAKNPLNEEFLRIRYNLHGFNLLDPFCRLYPYMEMIREEFCSEIELEKEYWYNPEELCYVLYNNYDLANLIMYINNIGTVNEFKTKKIKVIRPEKLQSLIKLLKKLHDDGKIERTRKIPHIPDLTIRKV